MNDELFSVQDRVTLVSGGSRGIGRGIAEGFAKRGAQVVITGRDQETLDQTAKEISTDDAEVVPLVCDVADPDAVSQLVESVTQRFGKIDVLINVAGVNRRKRAEQVSVEDYDFILDINLKGAFLLSVAAGKGMLERKSGVQINIASLNTLRPLKGV
ncbi:MAG: SDR family oxidoreductase, partial [Planctomycetales bacterium]